MRSALSFGLLGLAACGDGNPCYNFETDIQWCVGNAAVDLSARDPVFEIRGLGAVSPTQLSVLLVDEGAEDDVCDGSGGPTVWEVVSLPDGALPVTYGVVPEGGREEVPPRALEDGLTYVATFSVGSTSNTGWETVFVAGERGSLTWAELCP